MQNIEVKEGQYWKSDLNDSVWRAHGGHGRNLLFISIHNGERSHYPTETLNRHFALLTDEQVEEALIKEAKRRGFVDGATIKVSNENSISRLLRLSEIKYDNDRDSLVWRGYVHVCSHLTGGPLTMGAAEVYKEGNWAEIIEEGADEGPSRSHAFHDEAEGFVSRIAERLRKKDEQYTDGKNPFRAFDRAAQKRGVTAEEALRGMAVKHEVSIDALIEDSGNGKELDQDYIDEKFGDLIGYYLLLWGMISDKSK